MSKMILIIEDEESIQNIIKAFLEDAGYTVVLAADGLEGIVIFETDNKKPIKKITIGDEVCQEISTFQNMLIIKCKNGLFIYLSLIHI